MGCVLRNQYQTLRVLREFVYSPHEEQAAEELIIFDLHQELTQLNYYHSMKVKLIASVASVLLSAIPGAFAVVVAVS